MFSAHFKHISVFCKFHLVHSYKCYLLCLCIYRAKRNWCVPRYLLGDCNGKDGLHKAHSRSTDHVHRVLLFTRRGLGHGLCSLPAEKYKYKYTNTQQNTETIWSSFVFWSSFVIMIPQDVCSFLKLLQTQRTCKHKKQRKQIKTKLFFLSSSRGLCRYV